MEINSKRTKIAIITMFFVSLAGISQPLAFGEDNTTGKKAAEQGNAKGTCICSGSQVRDEPNIIEIKKAAELGNAEAQRKLGLKYFNGNGVLEDYQKAADWYKKAAEQGDEMSQWFLGGMYDEGKGVWPDEKQALFWYGKAAEQGSMRAQFRLGELFAEGHAVRQNDMVAYAWYSLATAQGDVIAAKKRALIAKRFTPEQHSKAQALAAELQAKIKQGGS